MARNKEAMSDKELEEFRNAMLEQGEELREALAEDLGGDFDDHWNRQSPDSST